ncbi:unnamed protein product [Aspergillus oryzae var. brunneus]|uniref:Unnamed protein product n=1 Tax=Aspergillus oryzae var. brunneus TaxID=332754 RepID=A0ABQ6L039_ASPOZ|nr:unnamed protein product [Aspergillus oryzae var. brunneus]
MTVTNDPSPPNGPRNGHQSPGLWRHPEDESHRFNDIDHWIELAKLLESAKFHGIFIADVLGKFTVNIKRGLDSDNYIGGYDVYKGPRNLEPAIISGAQWPVNEPLAVVPAMAAATKNIGFGVTVTTTYEQPYHLARRLSTIDHLTKGRPQRTPVILQAGTSKSGKAFAAQHAGAIFVAGHSPVVVAKNVAEIRELAKTQFGRDPQSIKFLALICPVLGRTEEEAQEKFKYYRSLGSIDGALALFGGWTGINLDTYGDDEELRHVESNAIRYATPGVDKWTKSTVGQHITVGGLGATPVGTPEQVADEMERWVREADVDGFNLPGSFKDMIELLIPELRRRGLFWDDYAVNKGTYRENLYGKPGQSGPPEDHPAAKYRWNAGVDAQEHKIPDN